MLRSNKKSNKKFNKLYCNCFSATPKSNTNQCHSTIATAATAVAATTTSAAATNITTLLTADSTFRKYGELKIVFTFTIL